MGRALEVITGQAASPGATLTAITMNAGDSATVRSANPGAGIHLLNAWAFTETNLQARIRSPRMHDQAQNMRFQPTSLSPFPLLPYGAMEPLYPQDNMTLELAGAAAATDLLSLLIYYDDLPGTAANLHLWSEIAPLVQHLTVVEVDVVSSGTPCNYGPTRALNADFDTLIRNRQYALIGWECAVTGGTLGFRGSDTGNIRLGGPLMNQSWVTSEWFKKLGEETNLPCVPVFNSANVAAILLDVAAQAATATFKVGVHLALLSDGSALS